MESEYILRVQVRTAQLPSGTFSPRIFVRQEGVKDFTTLSFIELEEQKEFDTEAEAISFGERIITDTLQEKYPQANIIIDNN